MLSVYEVEDGQWVCTYQQTRRHDARDLYLGPHEERAWRMYREACERWDGDIERAMSTEVEEFEFLDHVYILN